MFSKYSILLILTTFSSSLANISINVYEDCGVTSEWLKCLDHCEDNDLNLMGRAPWAVQSCSAKCTNELSDAFEQEMELPESPKFNTNKEKCLRKCWCDNTDTRYGLKGTPCHLACRYSV